MAGTNIEEGSMTISLTIPVGVNINLDMFKKGYCYWCQEKLLGRCSEPEWDGQQWVRRTQRDYVDSSQPVCAGGKRR